MTDFAAHQAWMQAALLRPDADDRLVAIRVRSARGWAGRERLAVYARAYYGRLIDCMGALFPVLKRAVGAEIFAGLAHGYLDAHPSRSPSLAHLGARFADFLERERPGEPSGLGWPDFLVELARFEHVLTEVYDGPGPEADPPFDAERAHRLSNAERIGVTYEVAEWLVLCHHRFPVNAYVDATRRSDGEAPRPPGPKEEFVAVGRHAYRVRRTALSQTEYELLGALRRGISLADALRATREIPTPEALGEWFHRFAREHWVVPRC